MRGHFLGGDEQFERSGLSNQARQALRSSPTCDEAESGSAMAEHGIGRGNSAMASEGEIESAAHAMAFDRCDHSCREVGD